ncbi:hypothetical protein RDI58_019437 [Solanum bulbocastanum]|uniref:Uncharacterized protein n=1 Tax=Solanum bulbocastanum TaxID=147425 RepID=A0AAN8TDA2_SOLBU
MFNLYRCSQALFPGEMILEEAKNFTYNFLHQYLANNQSKDKWVIAKDIPGEFLHQLGKETYQDLGIDIHHQLHNVWEEWFMSLNNTPCQEEAELLVHTINLAAGHMTHDEILSKHTNKVCHMLNEFQNGQISNSSKARDIEFYMKALVKLVFSNTSSNNINQDIKQTFFAVVKTFYYTAHVSEDTINHHISKVLFQKA